MNKNRIVIVGGGLSAIYSFHGALEAGYTPYDIDVLVSGKNPRLGSIFMYTSPIPWTRVKVETTLWGTCDVYSKKQWNGQVSQTSAHTRFSNGEITSITEDLYDPENLYQTIWSKIPIIKKIDLLTERDLRRMKDQYKAVICTFPDELTKHDYKKYIVHIPISFRTTPFPSPSYVVVYNGLLEVPWVRRTIMPGRIYTEYPSGFENYTIQKFEELRESDQPVEITRIPDLKPFTPPLVPEQRISGNLLRVGRQAVFSRNYLSHYAQVDTRLFLEEL